MWNTIRSMIDEPTKTEMEKLYNKKGRKHNGQNDKKNHTRYKRLPGKSLKGWLIDDLSQETTN